MQRGNYLLLFYSIGSDSKTVIRQGLIKTVKAIVPSDPAALAGDISVALLTTVWGLVSSALAVIPFIVFLVLFLKYRKILREISRRE